MKTFYLVFAFVMCAAAAYTLGYGVIKSPELSPETQQVYLLIFLIEIMGGIIFWLFVLVIEKEEEAKEAQRELYSFKAMIKN